MSARTPMDDDEFAAICKAAVEDAVDYIDTEISPSRAEVLRYYHGLPFGDEEPGRSQIVSRDVHDNTMGLLPSVMRVFMNEERVLEFEAGGDAPEDAEQAEQQTDYVDHVIMRDNPGFQELQAAFIDGLRTEVGFIKAWWDVEQRKRRVELSGLDDVALGMALDRYDKYDDADFEDQEQDPEDSTWSLAITYTQVKKRIRVAAVPPEEVIISRGARCIDSAPLVAHRREETVSNLVGMGYERELVEELAGSSGDETLNTNEERILRDPSVQHAEAGVEATADRKVLYVEGYIYADYDGDGINELRKVCMMGSGLKVVSNRLWDERPFADFRAYVEPHAFFPESPGEKVMDIQRIKSVTWRGVLDSGALALNPRTLYDPKRIDFDELANPEIGALMAIKGAGGIDQVAFPLTTPFTGAQLMPVLEALDAIKETRTGISKAAAGLDAKALQSSSELGIAATMTRADQQAELIARNFAEGGMKRLFRLVLRLSIKHQEPGRKLKLRGKWQAIDPSSWDDELNLETNVLFGVLSDEAKLQALGMIYAEQKAIYAQLGPGNKIVTLRHLHTTLSKMLAIRGYRAPGQFFADPTDMPDEAMQPPAPQPTPEQVIAQATLEVERMRTEKTLAIEDRKLALEERKMQLEDDRKRDEMAMEHERALLKIEADTAFRREQAEINAAIERTRISVAAEPAPAGA